MFNELKEKFMSQRKSKIKNLISTFFFLTGLSIGVLLIWPGVLQSDSRRCFFKIINDGSDGKVKIGTILSIDPSSLVKINNAKNTYDKILRIGDYCFRK